VTTLRVLVADDNEDHLFLTVRALQEVPDVELDIKTASNGEEALDAPAGRQLLCHQAIDGCGPPRGPAPGVVLLDVAGLAARARVMPAAS
jgi:CheY-like chemotaxis protein